MLMLLFKKGGNKRIFGKAAVEKKEAWLLGPCMAKYKSYCLTCYMVLLFPNFQIPHFTSTNNAKDTIPHLFQHAALVRLC